MAKLLFPYTIQAIPCKRGVSSLALFNLLELVLSFLVFVALAGILYSMVSSASYHQQFFAKDNAYVAEILHAVPNGELHAAYLWDNTQYSVRVQDDKVSVALKDKSILKNERTKYFGTSEQVEIEGNAFAPHTFEWRALGTGRRSISVDQTFSPASTCPASQSPLNGFSTSGSEEGLPPGTAKLYLTDAWSAVSTTLGSKGVLFGTSGPSVHVHAILTPGPVKVRIYSTTKNDQAARFACILATTTGTVLTKSVPPISSNSDVVLVINTPDADSLTAINGIIRTSVDAYRGGAHG